jgi:hypothetical protein
MKDSFQTISYRICVRGRIPRSWSEAFADLHIDQEKDACGELTWLSGNFSDPAALQGILNNLCMLGLVLIAVDCQGECPEKSARAAAEEI